MCLVDLVCINILALSVVHVHCIDLAIRDAIVGDLKVMSDSVRGCIGPDVFFYTTMSTEHVRLVTRCDDLGHGLPCVTQLE